MSAERLQSLAAVQARLLRHALSFPNVKKVAYSTCSTSSEENEEVIAAVLSDEAAAFEAETCLPSWQRRGLDAHERGRCFLRADPDLDLCNGFFVAVLKRKSGDGQKRKVEGRDKADGDSCKKSHKKRKKHKKGN